ncbi:MAG: glycosyltransferase family 39 protein [Planctomycetota bacterium]
MNESLRLPLFFFLLLLFGSFAHGYIDNPDSEVEYQTARSIARRGGTGLSLTHEDASPAERMICERAFDVMPGRDGKLYSWFGLGHALSILPFYAAGRGLAALFPGFEARIEKSWASAGAPERRAVGDEFFSRFLVSMHSPLFGALLGVVLLALLGRLGFGAVPATLAVLLATLTTQLGPESRESMGTVQSAFFLLWSLERSLAYRLSTRDRPGRLLAAGMLGGFAVLSRVTHVLPLLALGLYLLHHAVKERRFRGLACFALGGLPFALWLLWFNQARFGTPFETGYSEALSAGYWNFNFLIGFGFLALSPGKGAFLFSPLLCLAPVGLARSKRTRKSENWLLLSFLLAPWILNSFTTGWHSSHAWGSRYMTLGTVLLVALAAAVLLERGGRRMIWALLILGGLGLVINLGGWLTPYHGYYDLAFRAIRLRWPEVPRGDLMHYLVAEPRMSPLLCHWIYAWHSLWGAIGDPAARGPYESLFGVSLHGAAVPAWPEDAAFRHLRWIGLSAHTKSVVPILHGLPCLGMAAVEGIRLGRRVHGMPAATRRVHPPTGAAGCRL